MHLPSAGMIRFRFDGFTCASQPAGVSTLGHPEVTRKIGHCRAGARPLFAAQIQAATGLAGAVFDKTQCGKRRQMPFPVARNFRWVKEGQQNAPHARKAVFGPDIGRHQRASTPNDLRAGLLQQRGQTRPVATRIQRDTRKGDAFGRLAKIAKRGFAGECQQGWPVRRW